MWWWQEVGVWNDKEEEEETFEEEEIETEHPETQTLNTALLQRTEALSSQLHNEKAKSITAQ